MMADAIEVKLIPTENENVGFISPEIIPENIYGGLMDLRVMKIVDCYGVAKFFLRQVNSYELRIF
jgi:hypothetical protein